MQSLRPTPVLLGNRIPAIRPVQDALVVHERVEIVGRRRLASRHWRRDWGGRYRWRTDRRRWRRIGDPDPHIGRRHGIDAELLAPTRILHDRWSQRTRKR